MTRTFGGRVAHERSEQAYRDPHEQRVSRRGGGPAVSGLLLLSLIPVIAGMFRITDLTGGGAITADNARFFASPIPVIAHIVGATVYCLLGAFQFLPALRGRRGWHRIAGLILIPTGLIAALSGMWMAAFYTFPDGSSPLLVVIRLAFGAAMVASIVLAIVAIRRRDFTAHGAWMTRAYALGIAAGTQAVVFAIWILAVGPVDSLTDALLMGAAWVINAGVAELVIRRRAHRSWSSDLRWSSLSRPAEPKSWSSLSRPAELAEAGTRISTLSLGHFDELSTTLDKLDQPLHR